MRTRNGPASVGDNSALIGGLMDDLEAGMTTSQTSELADSLEAFYNSTLEWSMPKYQSNGDPSVVDALESPEYDEILLLAPPGHSKSTLGCAYAAWRLGNDPNLRVMVATHTTTYSQSLMRFIEGIISTDEFVDTFGDLIPDEGSSRWTASEKELVRTEWKSGHPSLLALGVGSSTIGYRADLIICDDLVTQQNSMTATQRGHLSNWFWGSLVKRLEPGGKIVVIGARFYKGDLYGKLRGDSYSAFEFESTPEDPLWPERYGRESLEKARRQNHPMFLAQYCQTPVDLEDQLLREKDLHYFVERPDSHKLQFFVGMDPTVKGRSESTRTPDEYGIAVGGYDGTTTYVVELVKAHGNKSQQIEALQAVANRWNPVLVLVESEAAQSWLYEDIKEEAPKMPVTPVTSDGMSKALRLTGLSTHFKNKQIVLPGRISTSGSIEAKALVNKFLAEWRGFPHEGDHLLDAVEIMSRGPLGSAGKPATGQSKQPEAPSQRSLNQTVFNRTASPATVFSREQI